MNLGVRSIHSWILVIAILGAVLLLTRHYGQSSQDRTGQEQAASVHPTSKGFAGQRIQNALEDARLGLDAIRRAANQRDWDDAETHFGSFQKATAILPLPELRHPEVSMALVDLFSLYNVQLERAIQREDSSMVMFASNQLNGIVEDLISQLDPGTPRELGRLRYLSRDIVYWADAGDEQMFEVRAKGLERLWTDLRPLVMYRNARKAAETFDLVLSQLKLAQRPEDFESLSPQLHDALRGVEAALAKH